MTNTLNIWENRYKTGGNSGKGSYNDLCKFKADIINEFISKNKIITALELGCGDGNQLSYFIIEHYIGLDISPTAIEQCKEKFKNSKDKEFYHYSDYNNQPVELTLSLDVIYHILEDALYIEYMKNLFNYSTKYVIIYSNNYNGHKSGHMYTKQFTDDINKLFPNWKLKEFIKQKYPEKSSADFYIYEKIII